MPELASPISEEEQLELASSCAGQQLVEWLTCFEECADSLWGTPFLVECERRVLPYIRYLAEQLNLLSVDVHDFRGVLVENMLARRGTGVFPAVCGSTTPWAYFAKTVSRWMRAEWGVVADPFHSDDFCGDTSPAGGLLADAMFDDTVEGFTSVLCGFLPARFHDDVAELVRVLALNPPQWRSYEGDTLEDVHDLFRDVFSFRQVREVAGFVWGIRPRQAGTSLLGRMLTDNDFDVTSDAALLVRLRRMRDGDLFPEQDCGLDWMVI